MSFDAYIRSGTFSADIGNYTSNMGGYFAWALSDEPDPQMNAKAKERCDSRDAVFGDAPKDGLVMLHELSANEALVLLDRAVERTLTAESDFLDEFNASNGWGSWPTALDYLRKIRDACLEHPEGVLRISY